MNTCLLRGAENGAGHKCANGSFPPDPWSFLILSNNYQYEDVRHCVVVTRGGTNALHMLGLRRLRAALMGRLRAALMGRPRSVWQ